MFDVVTGRSPPLCVHIIHATVAGWQRGSRITFMLQSLSRFPRFRFVSCPPLSLSPSLIFRSSSCVCLSGYRAYGGSRPVQQAHWLSSRWWILVLPASPVRPWSARTTFPVGWVYAHVHPFRRLDLPISTKVHFSGQFRPFVRRSKKNTFHPQPPPCWGEPGQTVLSHHREGPPRRTERWTRAPPPSRTVQGGPNDVNGCVYPTNGTPRRRPSGPGTRSVRAVARCPSSSSSSRAG